VEVFERDLVDLDQETVNRRAFETTMPFFAGRD
jgi:hypothetical protein